MSSIIQTMNTSNYSGTQDVFHHLGTIHYSNIIMIINLIITNETSQQIGLSNNTRMRIN